MLEGNVVSICSNTPFEKINSLKYSVYGVHGLNMVTFRTSAGNKGTQDCIHTLFYDAIKYTCGVTPGHTAERDGILFVIIILLSFTTHLRVLASSFLRFRDHTQ
jgi:hypothetical protein